MKNFLLIVAALFSIGYVFADNESTTTIMPESAIEQILLATESPIDTSESKPIEPKPIVAKKHIPIIIGLALGGGAAKGYAHIGVIQALEENGIKAQIITGTSAGSLVGSLYAYGYKPAQLRQIAYQMDEMNLADFTLNSNGLIKGNRLQQFVNSKVKNTPLQKLKTPFTAVATDLDSGQSVGFNNGDTGIAVRASCSIPNIFMPVKMNGHRYVDGGLSAPVPVTYARQAGANFIIAVDITARPENGRSGFLSNLDQTINIMGVKLLAQQLKQADVVIQPDTTQLSSFSFDKKKQAIDFGYKAAIAQMPLIKQKIAEWQKTH